MLSNSELRTIARSIVEKSKNTAHIDTGRLKRSISYVINLQGVFTFTEVFYGQFGDNSDLRENIEAMWPSDTAYNLIWVDDNGNPYQVVRKTSSGRSAVETKATKNTTRKSLGINGIKNFLKSFTNGKKENQTTDNSGQDNQSEP
jgi:hypothetical protein